MFEFPKEARDVTYRATPTISKLHKNNDDFVRAVMGPFGCLRGSTLIQTELGLVQIKDIWQDSLVLSWDGEKFCFAKSLGSFIKGNDFLYKLIISDIPLEAAGSHRILCSDNEYRKVVDLKVGDLLARKDLPPAVVDSIERLEEKEDYWDMQVLDTNNYVTADGCIHHNSGKSVGMCFEIMMRAIRQTPDLNNVRKSKWVVVRNTYRELQDTTIRTWHDWFPKEMGLWKQMDLTHIIHQYLEDGTEMELTVMFRALDKPRDISKLLSLELTGAWLNEAREIPKQILEALVGRIGRYPSPRDFGIESYTADLYWSGIICDTNPPDNDHWFYKMFEEDLPDGHILYRQPSGEDKLAENRNNLHPNYYTRLKSGRDANWVNVYVHGNYGFISDGKAIFPEYKDDIHATTDPILITPKKTVYVGIDFGLTPAAVIGQITGTGQIVILEEFVTFDMGAMNFGKLLHQLLVTKYKDLPLEVYGDPAGEQRAQTDEITPFQILWNQGIEAWPTYTNDFTIRREVIADYLQRLDFSGKPAFLIGPGAPSLRKAMAGGYKYRRLQVSGEERFHDKADKNKFSHVADALQYMMLGAVGGEKVIGGYGDQPIDYSNHDLGVV